MSGRLGNATAKAIAITISKEAKTANPTPPSQRLIRNNQCIEDFEEEGPFCSDAVAFGVVSLGIKIAG